MLITLHCQGRIEISLLRVITNTWKGQKRQSLSFTHDHLHDLTSSGSTKEKSWIFISEKVWALIDIQRSLLGGRQILLLVINSFHFQLLFCFFHLIDFHFKQHREDILVQSRHNLCFSCKKFFAFLSILFCPQVRLWKCEALSKTCKNLQVAPQFLAAALVPPWLRQFYGDSLVSSSTSLATPGH